MKPFTFTFLLCCLQRTIIISHSLPERLSRNVFLGTGKLAIRSHAGGLLASLASLR